MTRSLMVRSNDEAVGSPRLEMSSKPHRKGGHAGPPLRTGFEIGCRYSDRNAWTTSMRAARAAGISDARIAAATRIVAARSTGSPKRRRRQPSVKPQAVDEAGPSYAVLNPSISILFI